MHLSVTDSYRYSSVTSALRVLGIGFSYSQHSKLRQPSLGRLVFIVSCVTRVQENLDSTVLAERACYFS